MANTGREERGWFSQSRAARGAAIIQIQTCPIARTRRIIPGDLIRTFAVAGAKAKFKTAPATKKRRNKTASRLLERDTRVFSRADISPGRLLRGAQNETARKLLREITNPISTPDEYRKRARSSSATQLAAPAEREDRDERSERLAARRACRLIRASPKYERIARDKLTPDLAWLSRWVNARQRCVKQCKTRYKNKSFHLF